uniref:Retrotransposon protein, putative, unclassified n=1 Tax=Oryza sativa subsp. japonica TaxID=39947 RepID=Q339T7_ORYSJ|nr:retrotransposon protein, putative, unclassified [Oryza sativa Japonica Group]
MAEKQPPPPSSPGSVKGKALKPGLTDIIDDNGRLVQKYKIKVVADNPGTGSSKDGEVKQAPGGSAQPSAKGATDGSPSDQGDNLQEVHGVHGDGAHGAQGDGAQGPQGGNLNQNNELAQDFFNNFQDRVDYAVHPALINQSGVLVNTLSNMMKTIADGSIIEHQATGPVYLQGGVFPNYRSLVTDVQLAVQAVPSVVSTIQPTAPASTPLPAISAMASGQPMNPRLLMREHPQPTGQIVNQLTQDQVAAMFLPPPPIVDPVQQQPIQQTPLIQPVMVPEHLVRNIQPNLHNYQGGNLSYQYQPPSLQAQYQPGGLAQPQFAPQFGQFEPMQQQPQGAAQQRPWADKVLDFSKFSGQDGVSTYEHISRFLAQCSEESAIDALRVRLFRLSLSGSAFTWFSSLPYGSINSWANLEKQFHSYFYSGVHEMKLSDLTAIKQRHDEPVHEYIQREKFSSKDFNSLSHLIQKVTLHEHRSAEVRKSSKKVNHVCPYMYGSDDEEDDSEIAAAEWVRSKKVIPCQWVKGPGKEEKYDFDITKADKIFDLLLREKQIQLLTGHTIPSAEELGKKRYCKWHNFGSHSTNDCKVFRQQIQVAIEGGKD